MTDIPAPKTPHCDHCGKPALKFERGKVGGFPPKICHECISRLALKLIEQNENQLQLAGD